jgi:hypothetical protein
MHRRLSHLLAIVLFATFVIQPALARAKPRGKAERAALGKQMQRVANRLVSALRRTRPLKGLMSKRVTVTYRTSDRSEGTFKGKVEVDAATIDGTVAVQGMTGGTAWVPKEKKIKPRPKTVKLHVGKMAYMILKEIREDGRRDLITVDKKALTFYIESGAKGMTFHFRLEGKDKVKVLRVYKLGFSEDDPG